ncbi:MAG TPA: M55 family metallopeptidase [Candidatus Limnocylindrales bacterium]|nr:M55 family metallopeptidase [Candidatus Limnocylindrales bacterium]
MKTYISVDMEGIAGISHPAPTSRGDAEYPAAAALMAGEANAAIDGAFRGGATEVVVNDSHGGMHNLAAIDLDPRARLVQGQKAWSMVAGAGPGRGFGVALFVGYHARAGDPLGTIAHTYSSRPVATSLNGRPVGESGINAIALGAWGVPVGLVTGDDRVAGETAGWFPWAERVVVKEGLGRNAAISVHPTAAREAVRAGAERAVRRAIAGEMQLLVLEPPYAIEVAYQTPAQADFAASIPGAERFGDTGVRFAAADPLLAYRGFLAGLRLAGIVD